MIVMDQASRWLLKHWLPPDLSSLKMNMVGMVFRDEGYSGLGVIIRDDQHNFLVTLSHCFTMCYSLRMMKAIGLVLLSVG